MRHDWKPGNFDIYTCRRCGMKAFLEWLAQLEDDVCDPD